LSSGDISSVNLTTIAEAEPRRAELSSRDVLVEGFILDERTYVDNLERLLEFKMKIDTYGSSVQNDKLFAILHLLYPLADTQRRFLLALETVARQPRESQTWAALFWKWSEMSSMYVKFIANEKRATEYIRNVLADRQQYLDPSLSSVLRDSLRLLYLPSHRLPKYSGFLQVRPLLLIIPSYAPFCNPREFY
jgi:cell division control protein 24